MNSWKRVVLGVGVLLGAAVLAFGTSMADDRAFPYKTLNDVSTVAADSGPWGCDEAMEGVQAHVPQPDGSSIVFLGLHEKWGAAHFAGDAVYPDYVWMGHFGGADGHALIVDAAKAYQPEMGGPCSMWFLKATEMRI